MARFGTFLTPCARRIGRGVRDGAALPADLLMDLCGLLEKGLIRRAGKGRGTYYVLVI